MKNKKTLILSVIAIVALVGITIGTTLALLNYRKLGSTENTISSGGIDFIYEELDGMGHGIKIENAFPVSDTEGKGGSYFSFRVKSSTASSIEVPYEITLRKKDGSANLDQYVKVYLTKMENGVEVEKELDVFNNLSTVTHNGYSEKLLYQDTIPTNSVNKIDNYRLRIWFNDDETAGGVLDYSPIKECTISTYTNKTDCEANGGYWDSTQNYPNENKTFSITVNVYATGNQVAAPVTFAETIKTNNTLIAAAPTLTTSSNETSDASGLYSLAVTNGFGGSNGTTYYFRGNVENNYVDFAGKTWRIVRINEDGTVRLILDDSIDTNTYRFSLGSYYYYSNSEVKTPLDTWYTNNITGTNATKVATGNYFCEAAKVKYDSNAGAGNATMTVYTAYTPDFKCETDGNSKGLVNASVGLLTYDEIVRAGGYFGKANSDYYLSQDYKWWSMSPAGISSEGAMVWYVSGTYKVFASPLYEDTNAYRLRPIINLKSDVTVTGTGTSADPYVVE